MIKIAIVDDEPQDMRLIEKKLQNELENNEMGYTIHTYLSAMSMFDKFENESYDVVFLDIDMPDMDGMKAAERIYLLNKKTLIVFITNHNELVYKAFHFRAIGFIRKGFIDEEITEIINVLQKEICSNNLIFTINEGNVQVNIDLNEIIYIQSDDHYVEFHYTDKKRNIRKTISETEKLLSDKGFIRIHSRYLVNFRYIQAFESKTVILNEGLFLPISKSKYNSAKIKYQAFMRSI